MSQEFQNWSKDMIRQCIKECVRPSPQQSNTHVMSNDPYGLCLERYKAEKRHPASVEYRQYLLNEMHSAAERLLKILKDPDQIKRCEEIIKKTVSDNRANTKKNHRGVEVIDLFADM